MQGALDEWEMPAMRGMMRAKLNSAKTAMATINRGFTELPGWPKR